MKKDESTFVGSFFFILKDLTRATGTGKGFEHHRLRGRIKVMREGGETHISNKHQLNQQSFSRGKRSFFKSLLLREKMKVTLRGFYFFELRDLKAHE